MYIYIYIHMYKEGERKRERERDIYIYIEGKRLGLRAPQRPRRNRVSPDSTRLSIADLRVARKTKGNQEGRGAPNTVCTILTIRQNLRL